MTVELHLPKNIDHYAIANQIIGKYCVECRGQVCSVATTVDDDGATLTFSLKKFPMEKLFVTAISPAGHNVEVIQLCQLTNLEAYKGLFGNV